MDIQPRPIAVTVSAPRPNLRLCMSSPLAGILLHGPGAGARYNSAVRRIEAVVFDIGGVVQEAPRSEERRGGEEGRSRGAADHLKKKKKRYEILGTEPHEQTPDSRTLCPCRFII